MAKKSIMTDDMERCFICGKRATQTHHIFGGYLSYNRNHADDDGLFIPVCFDCHQKIHNERNQKLNHSLHQKAQWKYEETHTREEFRKRYGKSYL